LADARIMRLLPPLLGKAFYKRKKLPVQVNLLSKSLSAEIESAVNTVTLPLPNHGSCVSVAVGRSTLQEKQIVENILAITELLEKRYPGGWKNIRSIHLQKSGGGLSLPLYATLRDNQSVGRVTGITRPGREIVSGELSTQVGATVQVRPGGQVRVKLEKDPQWDEDIEVEADVSIKKDKNRKDKVIAEESEDTTDVVQSIQAKKKETEDDESEDELEDQELEYMAKVAAEEEEIEANEVKRLAQLQGTGKGSKNDEESENDVDDDAEAENLVSEGDESESEDELYMKNNSNLPESEDEEDTSASKKRKKNSKPEKKSKAKKIKLQPESKKKLKQKKFVEKKKKEKVK